jgi:hypothetical protein
MTDVMRMTRRMALSRPPSPCADLHSSGREPRYRAKAQVNAEERVQMTTWGIIVIVIAAVAGILVIRGASKRKG